MVLSQYDEEAYIKSEKEISFDEGYRKCYNELQPVIEEQDAKLKELSAKIKEQQQMIKLLDLKKKELEQKRKKL